MEFIMKSIKLLFVSLFVFFAMSASAMAKPISVGIVQLFENGAFTDMKDGFIGHMRKVGYDESKMTFDIKSAQGDATNLNSICQSMVDAGHDFIVAIATPAAQAMVNLESDIPTFFISLSNPVGARVISDMAKPDKNATGTSNAIPLEQIFDLADKLTPGIKTYGLLYTTSEINAVTTINLVKKYLDSKGLKYKEAIITNSAEVQQATQSLVGSVDALFIPNDSVIQSAMPLVAEVAREAKLPTYCSSNVTVEEGGLTAVAISDVRIGEVTAEMAVKYLNGTKIEDIPSVVVPATDTMINKTTADAIGITIPTDIEGLLIFEEK